MNIESLNLQEIIHLLKNKIEKLKSEITNLFIKANIMNNHVDCNARNFQGKSYMDESNWNKNFENKIKEVPIKKKELENAFEELKQFQAQFQILQEALKDIVEDDKKINKMIEEIDETVFPLIDNSWNKENIIKKHSCVSKINIIKKLYTIQETLKEFLSDDNKKRNNRFINPNYGLKK